MYLGQKFFFLKTNEAGKNSDRPVRLVRLAVLGWMTSRTLYHQFVVVPKFQRIFQIKIHNIYIHIWLIMVNKGNHPQMTLIQVSELL
jgi:hypothetical protein